MPPVSACITSLLDMTIKLQLIYKLGLSHSLIRRRVCYPPPLLVPRGGTHSLAGEGVGGGPNSDAGTCTAVLYNRYICTLWSPAYTKKGILVIGWVSCVRIGKKMYQNHIVKIINVFSWEHRKTKLSATPNKHTKKLCIEIKM
jgi:hypothetical protein